MMTNPVISHSKKAQIFSFTDQMQKSGSIENQSNTVQHHKNRSRVSCNATTSNRELRLHGLRMSYFMLNLFFLKNQIKRALFRRQPDIKLKKELSTVEIANLPQCVYLQVINHLTFYSSSSSSSTYIEGHKAFFRFSFHSSMNPSREPLL